MRVSCFITENKSTVPITVLTVNQFPSWLASQTDIIKTWFSSNGFRAEVGNVRLIPDGSGRLVRVVVIVAETDKGFGVGNLPLTLPEGNYQLEQPNELAHVAWGLGAYQFTRYKKATRQPAQLSVSPAELTALLPIVESIYLVRDWINTPTDDMGPTEFAAVAEQMAKEQGASFTQIIGKELLEKNYPCIYTVGRASDDAPRLIDLRWGNPAHPKVTLVGKGVCFDSGGLDIKSSSYMQLMKKDMAGGAHVLGLARMIMQNQLPVCLRVLVPVVENVISGNAYRPLDIIKSRKGLTIEIGNTDAEGRVILADALTEAVSEQPDLLIDITTLTGAARVALGTELPAVFSNQDEVVNALIQQGQKRDDPLWRLPLFAPYREYLNSPIADINNNSSEPYGGAITAALFLKEFVPDTIPWLHVDMMAWNLRPRPGRPVGGEAMTLRALLGYLSARYIV